MADTTNQRFTIGKCLPAFAACLLLAGCSSGLPTIPKIDSLNPFKKKEVLLPGKRVAILEQSSKLQAELAPANKPVALPPQQANTDWTQPGGNASNSPGHLALGGGLKRSWKADAGSGTSSKGRLTASPVTYNGRIFTLDVSSRVSGFSMSGGSRAWSVKLAPANEHGYEGFGGGLAANAGKLFVATGFGSVYALDPNNGKQIWEKKVGEPVRASPTAAGDRVYVQTTGGKLFALSGIDGSELWQYRGLPEETSISSNPSPAVSGDVVVVPFASGELVALNAVDGQPLWTEALSRTRTSSAMGTLNNLARPVIADGIVYAVGNSGRIIAARLNTGERLWSADVSGNQMPWVAGSNLFVVDTSGQLLALERQSGQIIWTTKLKGSTLWSGPVLAGGKLWLVSKKGSLVSIDGATGKTLGASNLGAGAYIAPIVAQGRLFVLADNANLVALH